MFTIRQKALVRDGLRKGVLALVPVLEAGESPIFAREIVEPHHLHHCSLLHARIMDAMAVPLTDASCESGSGSSCAGPPSALASSWSSRGAAEQAMAVCAVQGNI